RLKENGILREKASHLVDELDEITRNNKVDYAVVYGEFMYKAGPWPYERRVVCKVEKPENQMVYMYTFVVTNMDSSPEYL
ncbi:transposase, partial [Erysipelatoclostridium ramosum]